jgi:hypothetical protein
MNLSSTEERDNTMFKNAVRTVVFFLLLLQCLPAYSQQSPETSEQNLENSDVIRLSLPIPMSQELSPFYHEELLLLAGDSLSSVRPAPHLLPEHLSLMEQALWGENGFMRSSGIAPLTPSARKSELGVRRTMLTAHQIGGFLTMGLFIPTLIIGQQNINMWNDAAAGIQPFDRALSQRHQTIAVMTFVSYMATASMSIFAPPPFIRRDEASTTSLHKTLAWVHFTGMIATPFLASFASNSRSLNTGKQWRTAHQITAYVTAAAFTASLITVTF